ncbi:MAG: CpaF family protein [Firmicutes bacterium]|nr:CpaF family protein [Bacillota bacterium]
MNDAVFSQIDFGPLTEFLKDDDITDISYSNGGQVWLKTLSKGVYQVDRPDINNAFMEKLAFQCSNVMGKTFNMAHPFLDSESAELRMNFVHDSIATNGIACLIRKTPAKIRLNKDKLINEKYVIENLHDFLIKCVQGHCNIIVAGETGSGKTELVKYLASHTAENEKLITIEDTLELHLDRIFPHRDIVAMKTNNIASYTDVLVTCMRQNPKWILLSEVRSAEAVMAVRNSISSGHNILSTIHADKASSIPLRMYSLLETSQEVEQFLTTIHRYVQIGIYVKGYFSKRLNRFQREIIEVCEFYVDEDNNPCTNVIYKKTLDGHFTLHNPSQHLIDYMAIQNVVLDDDVFNLGESQELKGDESTDTSTKDESLKYNKEEAPKPEDASTLNKDINSNVSPENQAVAAQVSAPQVATPSVETIPTPQVQPVQVPPQSVSVQNETDESGDDGTSQTIKPSFTNPEEFSDIEVL